jgi:hypothetical protein
MFCPSCGTQNQPDHEYCARCGERVVAPDVERFARSELAKCARCGTINRLRAPHCLGCGVLQDQTTAIALSTISETPARPAPRQPRPDTRPTAPAAPPPRAAPRPPSDRPDPRFGPPTLGPEPATEPETARAQPVSTRAVHGESVNDSGSPNAVLPDELKGWNWGAFLLGPVWGLFNRVWFALVLAVIWILPFLPQWTAAPLVFGGLALIVYLGLKGNELAWRARRWDSVDQFRRVQQSWATWGLLVAIAQGILVIIGIVYRGS